MFFSEQHFGKRVSEKAIQNVCRVCVPETNFPVKEGDPLAERMKEFSDFYDNWRSNKIVSRKGRYDWKRREIYKYIRKGACF